MAANDQACCQVMFWVYLAISVGLVLFAGLMSGLTLGLMSLSLVDLEVLVKAGQPKDCANAAKILPVVKNQHLLLCTLLMGNALAMEALPIFLDALLPAWGAILISVTLILAFGEIIPQAICSRYGLAVGAKTAGIVRMLVLLFYPVAYPISKLLDWLLGKGHFALMRRAELKTLVDMHGNEAGKGGELTHDETTIITGALEMTQKTAKDAMTAISNTFTLDINSKLDMHTLGLIMTKGHSRVPIYSGSPTNVIGLILVKNLITCRPEDEVPIRNVTIRKIPRVYDDLPLYDILNEFQKGHSHMAVVVKHTKDIVANMEKSRNGVFGNGANQGDGSQVVSAEHLDIVTSTYPVDKDTPEPCSPVPRSNGDKHGDARSQPKKSERGRHNILDVSESLPSYSLDEEVVGIITMEDVMEELLQEEILDETDEYIDVHNKIKINMVPPGRSSSRSPKTSPLSHFQRRTPMSSPLSPYYQASVLQSPLATVPTPGLIPSFSSSLGKSIPSSPAAYARSGRSSPATHQVERKTYERLQKSGG
ncbi:DUF21 domain-containing protein-like [Iris pallida]|uniref:DUF21 domain-containing protein-like n=1 Tax=Iris pallida TaxID=29817 RepID=A0AAX6EVB7_IRIPA|nr:DUF21 domain-containing protein-like [Iris pallida]